MMSRLDRSDVELSQYGAGRDLVAVREAIQCVQPDVVLNLFEGFGDDPNSECEFARLLGDEGVAFTGASAEVLWRTGRKDIAKQILTEAELPTPPWITVEDVPLGDCRLNWPVIVKPAYRDASVGIHQSNVVARLSQLNQQIVRIAQQYGLPVVVEEFIDGREISVALFDWPELTVLPIVETKFACTNGNWPIDSYDAKWNPGSHDDRARTLHYPADLSANFANKVVAAAKAAYRALGCRGFATIDFRIRDQVPYILEVNSNADLKPSNCLIDLLQLSGVDYNDFLWQMIHTARLRRSMFDHVQLRQCGI